MIQGDPHGFSFNADVRFKQIYLFENVSVEVIGAHDWAFVLAEKRLLDMEGVPKKTIVEPDSFFGGGKKYSFAVLSLNKRFQAHFLIGFQPLFTI